MAKRKKWDYRRKGGSRMYGDGLKILHGIQKDMQKGNHYLPSSVGMRAVRRINGATARANRRGFVAGLKARKYKRR